jgi:hypothetical protein
MVYTDSDEAGGPPYAWLDATTGESWPLADGETTAIELPFSFTFYGAAYDEVTVSGDGALFFVDATAGLTCPTSATTWTGVAVLAMDVGAGVVHTATFGNYPHRTFVISWDDFAAGSGTGSWQAWLVEGRDEVVLAYADLDFGDATLDDGVAAVVGTGSPDGALDRACGTAIAAGSTAWFADASARPARPESSASELDDPWTGDTAFQYAGTRLAGGDVNGDGVGDALVGTPDEGAGEVYLLYRPWTAATFASADATFTGEATDDELGEAVLLADLDGDGGGEVVAGAPGNDDNGQRAGATYVWEGASWSGTVATTDADGLWIGPASGRAESGSALASADVDGDGYADLVVGAPKADASGADSGAVYLVLGGSLPSGSTALSSAAASFSGRQAGDQLGATVAAGDLDGDDAAELLLAAPYAEVSDSDAGLVYLLAGGSWAGTASITASYSCRTAGTGAGDHLGSALLVADIDGSGSNDWILTSTEADGAYSGAGRAYVGLDRGPSSCVTAAASADAVISGTNTSANLGAALAAGDIDGDGQDDLVVSADNASDAAPAGGAVYAFVTAPSGDVDADSADFAVYGDAASGQLGSAVAVVDDDDGWPTVLMSAPFQSVTTSADGALYAWSYAPDFADEDGDGFVAGGSGGNDCDDGDASAYPGGADDTGDWSDGDCDGWVDGVVRTRTDQDGFEWDLALVGASVGDTLNFEDLSDGDAITVLGDVTFDGSVTAQTVIGGTYPEGELAARVAPGLDNTVTLSFAGDIDGLAFQLIDADDTFTFTARRDGGDLVAGFPLTVSAPDRTAGQLVSLVFADDVDELEIVTDRAAAYGLDEVQVAWAADSDRDGDGWSDADGDCDDGDAAVSPDATEILGNGVDDDCDGTVDGGDATAYTDATAWLAAAGVDPETIDFEDVAEGEVVEAQYASLGATFDGNLRGAGDVDGTAPNGSRGGEADTASVGLTFDEIQPAVALTLLDGDGTFTFDGYVSGTLAYSASYAASGGTEFVGYVFDLGVDELVVTGPSADSWGVDDVVFSVLGLDDADGDGLTEAEGDCDDADAGVYPGAEDTPYDGVDADCAGDDDYDVDHDGSRSADWGGTDCDDGDASVNPDAEETYYDGVDSDCDGASDFDADEDGFDDEAYGGTDCDDGDATANPDAEETYYDGVDSDCDDGDDWDADGDGYASLGGSGGLTDCDDGDASANPGADEVWYDGVDNDCSGDGGSEDYDQDGDGHDSTAWGGDDCEDTEPYAYLGAPGEVCYDGVDTDCDGADDYDCDQDGQQAESFGGEDCDDADASVYSGAPDVTGDGVDSNCDGIEYDFDGDGYEDVAYGGDDCDEADATVNPGATDACYDGIDQDCDGASDYDCDGDGSDSDLYGGDDCDDTDATVSPAATDWPYDGVDQDCDGASDDDQDGDGYDVDWYGGDDCDDTDPAVYPGAYDACYDGLDADCAGDDDDDCDGDGWALDLDCDDADATVYPGAAEVEDDAIDQDCDGADAEACVDCDGDGWPADTDCDDTDAAVHPDAADTWYDGVDSDCDGADDYDQDGDGSRPPQWGGGDCDDANADVGPHVTTDDCSNGDEDCDGAEDEDCAPPETGETGTTPVDTGEPGDTGTRDTDWRPDPQEVVAPQVIGADGRCGCASGTPGTAAGAGFLAWLAARRRRRRSSRGR